MKRKLTLFTILLITAVCLFTVTACEEKTLELCFEEYDNWIRVNPDTVPASNDLQGTYDLDGFLVYFYLEGDPYLTLNEGDFLSYSGTMDIGISSISQSITLDGDNENISATYVNSIADTWSGTLHIDGGGWFYDVDYDIAGGVLTTYSGVVCEDVPESDYHELAINGGTFGSLIAPVIHY